MDDDTYQTSDSDIAAFLMYLTDQSPALSRGEKERQVRFTFDNFRACKDLEYAYKQNHEKYYVPAQSYNAVRRQVLDMIKEFNNNR